jgi:extracellular elastinolytic metalloproteinase
MGQNWMITFVDALDKGAVYGAVDYVSDNWTPPSRTGVAPAGTGVGVDGTAKFRVYKFGLNDPSEGQRTLQKNPWHRDASPNGWQVAGTKTYTTTKGNNGIAQENWNGGDDYENNQRPDAGPEEDFDYPYDQDSEDPHEYINAAVTQLYYTANMVFL